MERKAKLEQAQLNLGYTIIRSPVNGIIGKKSAEIQLLVEDPPYLAHRSGAVRTQG